MKIFNWMHRKLQHGGGGGGGSSSKCFQVPHKKEVSKGEQAMMMAGIFEGAVAKELRGTLTDGAAMLTIGTLGTDHGGGFLPQEDPIVLPAKEEAPAADPKSTGDDPSFPAGKGKEIEMAATKEIEEEEEVAEIVQEPAPLAPPLRTVLLKEEKKDGKRTTLAHLFAAEPFTAAGAAPRDEGDSGSPLKSSTGIEKAADSTQKKMMKKQQQQKKKKKGGEQNGSGGDGKLQKLITKMLKKKIHPMLPKTVEMDVSHALHW